MKVTRRKFFKMLSGIALVGYAGLLRRPKEQLYFPNRKEVPIAELLRMAPTPEPITIEMNHNFTQGFNPATGNVHRIVDPPRFTCYTVQAWSLCKPPWLGDVLYRLDTNPVSPMGRRMFGGGRIS